MSKKPTSAEVLALFRELEPKEQSRVLRALTDPTVHKPQNWLTLEEVAQVFQKSKSQISRYAKQGILATNGAKHRHLRISLLSILQYHLQELRRATEKLFACHLNQVCRLPEADPRSRSQLIRRRSQLNRSRKEALKQLDELEALYIQTLTIPPRRRDSAEFVACSLHPRFDDGFCPLVASTPVS
jgi:hypothetical protein